MNESSSNCFPRRESKMNFKYEYSIATFVFSVFMIEGALMENKSRKRYLTFPKGSTLSVQICLTYQMGLTPGYIFTEAVNWGINYPLEIKEETTSSSKASEEMSLRRERRSLLSKLEKMLYHMGYDGRDCILRALCEFSSIYKTADKSIETELLKIFFEYKLEWPLEYELEVDKIYYRAHKIGEGMNKKFCYESFPNCHFSLISLLSGAHDVNNIIEYMRK